MIPEITELNFPSYATINSATASLSDMGERIINAQVKIDGAVRPSFVGTDGKPWEIEFLGERYIQPLLEPQASKDNTSLNSTIELTFRHWAIYQMKRYLFVALANVQSGTPIVDKYIVPLGLTLPEFAEALDDILLYYFPDRSIYVKQTDGSYINPNFTDYDGLKKYIELDYTYIWEVLQKTYELFSCWWSIKRDDQGNYAIWFGYPVQEHDHEFSYDAVDGGLVKLERQVQDPDIRNELLGRGGTKNIPYMYFKDYEKFHPNASGSAYENIGLPDPDAIPELENILFTELRDSNFRSYVQGWKVNTHRQSSTPDGWSVTWNQEGTEFTESDGTTYSLDTERLETDWAYAKGATDELFDPVEFVKDDESIEKYGLLQGGLENNEAIFPSLQGMLIDLPCIIPGHGGHEVETRADEVVDVEPVVTDEIKSNNFGEDIPTYMEEYASPVNVLTPSIAQKTSSGGRVTIRINAPGEVIARSAPFTVGPDYSANFIRDLKASAWLNYYTVYHINFTSPPGAGPSMRSGTKRWTCEAIPMSYEVRDAATDEPLVSVTNIPQGEYYVAAKINVMDAGFTAGGTKVYGGTEYCEDVVITSVNVKFSLVCDYYKFNGEIISNRIGSQSISARAYISKGGSHTFNLTGTEFTVPVSGAISINQPIDISPLEYAAYESTIRAYNVNTHEIVAASSLPPGRYRMMAEVKVTNNDVEVAEREFVVTLLPAFLYYNMEYEEWKPTFDIWIKNVFNTDRGEYASDDLYVAAVWEPLVTTQEMTVTFATGNLSGHSDWEFKVAKNGIHYDNSKTLIVQDEQGVDHEVRSEWRLTLIKSDAEADAIHKYVPYQDFNAAPYDLFYFTNIYLPWAYVFAAERRLNAYKEGELDKVKEVDPTWVVGLNKIWASKYGAGDILTMLSPGDKILVKDSRFIKPTGVQLIVQSMSIAWASSSGQESFGLPDIELVLSNKTETSLSTLGKLSGEVKELSAAVSGFSNLERQIRKVGDAIYLRKDGFEDTSYSPTNLAKPIRSDEFRKGHIDGVGWSIEVDDDGSSILEIDKLNVRKEMNVGNLIVNQITAMGGKEILSAASMVITALESYLDGDPAVQYYRCYFDTKSGTLANLFVAGDIVMSQRFDAEKEQTKYYRCVVTGVGLDYVVLSFGQRDGTGAPEVGDVLVQYGNINNPARQRVIIRETVGDACERMLTGLNSVSASGQIFYYAGMNDGEPYWYVGDTTNYARYQGGELEVKAKVKILPGSDGADNILSWVETDGDGDVTTIAGGAVLSKIIGVASNGEMVAGVNASEQWQDSTHGKLSIFAGTDATVTPDNAPFRVYADGTVVATEAEISGTVHATDGDLFSLTARKTRNPFVETATNFNAFNIDNVYAPLALISTGELDWTVASSGRRMCLIGRISLFAPLGGTQKFFENGVVMESVSLQENEGVELLGWGTESDFYGWIIINRFWRYTADAKGRGLNAVAIGTVAADGSFVSYKTFDKKSIVATRAGTATGVYWLYLPKRLFASKDDIQIQITPCPDDTSAATATMSNIEDTGITEIIDGVQTDCYRLTIRLFRGTLSRDSKFSFIIYNIKQW